MDNIPLFQGGFLQLLCRYQTEIGIITAHVYRTGPEPGLSVKTRVMRVRPAGREDPGMLGREADRSQSWAPR